MNALIPSQHAELVSARATESPLRSTQTPELNAFGSQADYKPTAHESQLLDASRTLPAADTARPSLDIARHSPPAGAKEGGVQPYEADLRAFDCLDTKGRLFAKPQPIRPKDDTRPGADGALLGMCYCNGTGDAVLFYFHSKGFWKNTRIQRGRWIIVNMATGRTGSTDDHGNHYVISEGGAPKPAPEIFQPDTVGKAVGGLVRFVDMANRAPASASAENKLAAALLPKLRTLRDGLTTLIDRLTGEIAPAT